MFFEDDVSITINNRDKEKEKKLERLKTVEEILVYSSEVIKDDYFFEVIQELLDKDKFFSFNSFRCLVMFVSSLDKLHWPVTLVVSEALFVMNWCVKDRVTCTLRFNDRYMVSYVISKKKSTNNYEDIDWWKGTCYALDVMNVLEEIVHN